MTNLDAQAVIELLGLEPLPREGGMWAQTWRDDNGSAIYFLLRPGDYSALHRLGGPEVWHFYAGDPVQMVLLRPDGTSESPVLHNNLATEARPVAAVETGVWMGAYTTGTWSLIGTTMAPPFDESTFELLDRASAEARYPDVATHIRCVTASSNGRHHDQQS